MTDELRGVTDKHFLRPETAMETIKEIEATPDYNESTIVMAHLHQEFLLRAFRVMLEIATESHQELISSFPALDLIRMRPLEAFEERMRT